MALSTFALLCSHHHVHLPKKLSPLNANSPPRLSAQHPPLHFCLHESDESGTSRERNDSVCLFVSAVLHLACCPRFLLVGRVSESPSFLPEAESCPLCVDAPFAHPFIRRGRGHPVLPPRQIAGPSGRLDPHSYWPRTSHMAPLVRGHMNAPPLVRGHMNGPTAPKATPTGERVS